MEANPKERGRVRKTDAGSISFSVGPPVDAADLLAVAARPARALGPTRTASYHHTSQVLPQAALAGTTDSLRGPKVNVLPGRLIPAGIGFPSPCRGDIDEPVRGDE